MSIARVLELHELAKKQSEGYPRRRFISTAGTIPLFLVGYLV